MKKEKRQLAVVLDEYGGMTGIVTLNDLVEQLVGDLGDDDSQEEEKLFKKIGESAFEKCGEDAEDAFEIVLPKSVTASSYAFKGAKVKSVRTLIK